jgi:hypothetical protein
MQLWMSVAVEKWINGSRVGFCPGDEALVVHRRQEASTVQPVSFALPVPDMWADRPFSGVADAQDKARPGPTTERDR